jgi:pSer/pThr/pTyr-binding forkhead associated (FHA) protein
MDPLIPTNTDAEEAARSEPALPAGTPQAKFVAPQLGPTTGCQSDRPVILVGSRPDCDLPLDQPGVSRVHCALVSNGRSILVCDLCSRCGTFVNGERIRMATLRPGDALRVGPVGVEAELEPASGDVAAGVTPAQPLRGLVVAFGGRRVEMRGAVSVIGRRASCDLVVDTPDVSLVHALVFALSGCPAVCDLASRSGTYLNGRRVSLAWLHDGDQLTIGGEQAVVRWNGPVGSERDEPRCARVNAGAGDAGANPQPVGQTVSPTAERQLTAGIAAARRQQPESARQDRLGRQAAERPEREQAKQGSDGRRAELEAWAVELQEERTRLRAERTELETRQTACEQADTEMSEREAVCAAREAALEVRQRELARLEAALAEQQAGDTDGPAGSRQFAPAAAPERTRVFVTLEAARRAGRTGRGGEVRKAPLTGGQELPAPTVAQPLFNALDRSCPNTWPTELRARLRVLRRVSDASEKELVAYMLSERRGPADAPSKPSLS